MSLLGLDKLGPLDVPLHAARRSRGPLGVTRYVGDPGQPALQNGWTSYETTVFGRVAFVKDSAGFVRLSGTVMHSNAPAGIQNLFILPVNYRPSRMVIWPMLEWQETHDSFGNLIAPYKRAPIWLHTDGRIQVEAAGDCGVVILDGKRFQAA